MTRFNFINKICIISLLLALHNSAILGFAINPQPGENIWHLAAGIGTGVDQLAQNPCDLAGTFTMIHAILDKTCTIESKINTLGGCPLSEFQATWTALAVLGACNATPITSITTISAPGSYCLATSLSAPGTLITIASSDVVLDLNGQTLSSSSGTGISIKAAANITIKNGFCENCAVGVSLDFIGLASNIVLDKLSIVSSSSQGINFSNPAINITIRDCIVRANFNENIALFNCKNILLENCIWSDSAGGNGITILSSSDVLIKNCQSNHNFVQGLALTSCTNITIQDSLFNNNGQFGGAPGGENMRIVGCRNLTVNRCNFNETVNNAGVIIFNSLSDTSNLTFNDCLFNNNFFGLFFNITSATNASECIEFNNCQFNGNTTRGVFFDGSQSAKNISFNNCFACKNQTVGFDVFLGINVCLNQCIANENNVGFLLENNGGGGSGPNQPSGLLKECLALGNATCGFQDHFNGTSPTITKFTYIANLAKGNGMNPAGSTTPGTDSNYCIGTVATQTSFTPPGPATTGPYLQISTSKNPKSYWDNITLS